MGWGPLVPVTLLVAACASNPSSTAVGDAARSVGDASGSEDAETCSQISARAAQQVSLTLRAAEMDLTCRSDDDCVFASTASQCTASCGNLLSQTGLASIQTTIADVNAHICTSFVERGCAVLQPPCVAPASAACVQGMCANFPPARWASFSVDKHAVGGTSVPPSCTTGQDCTVWTVTPDHRLIKNAAGVTSAAMLSDSEFATVDAILRSATFRGKEEGGLSCGASPTGTNVSFVVERTAHTIGFDVTACIAADEQNDAARLYRSLTTY